MGTEADGTLETSRTKTLAGVERLGAFGDQVRLADETTRMQKSGDGGAASSWQDAKQSQRHQFTCLPSRNPLKNRARLPAGTAGSLGN